MFYKNVVYTKREAGQLYNCRAAEQQSSTAEAADLGGTNSLEYLLLLNLLVLTWS